MECSSVCTELCFLEFLPPYFLPVIMVSIKSMLSCSWVARQAVSGEEKAVWQKERGEREETDSRLRLFWTLHWGGARSAVQLLADFVSRSQQSLGTLGFP